MNITCENGNICCGQENYREQCDVFYGPNCKYPCDTANCEENIELDTMCWEYTCTPVPPSPPASYLAAQICLPIIGLVSIVLLVCLLRKRIQIRKQKRADENTPIIRNSVYRETTEPKKQPSIWDRIRSWWRKPNANEETEPLLSTVSGRPIRVDNRFCITDEADEIQRDEQYAIEVAQNSPAILSHSAQGKLNLQIS